MPRVLAARVIPKFPINVVGVGSITVDKTNGIYRIGNNPFYPLGDAPIDDVTYGRLNAGWTQVPTMAEINALGDASSINARDFGATGDGVTDDTAALNAFFAAIRSATSTYPIPEGVTPRGVIPPGVYKCGNVNATNIRAMNWMLECQGAVLYGNIAAKPVLDMMGTRWFTVRDLTIYGDQTNKPTFGLQHGRIVANESNGECRFINLKMDGYFTKASYINLGAEIVTLEQPHFYNHDTGASYCAVLDNKHAFGVASDFATIALTPNTSTGPFHQTLWLNADFRKIDTGRCLMMIGDLYDHRFITSYMASFDDYPIYLWQPETMAGLYFDVHVETTGALGWLLIDNTSPGLPINIASLTINDSDPNNGGSMVEMTGGSRQVVLLDLDLAVSKPLPSLTRIAGVATGAGLFAWGQIKWNGYSAFSLAGMAFNGTIMLSPSVTSPVTHGPGAYRIIRSSVAGGDDRTHVFKGPVRAFGTGDTSAPDVYLEMQGNVTSGNPMLIAGGTAADIHLAIIPKGAGHVWFGTHTANADAPVTGYVTIRDVGGVLRKLAVIA